MDQLGPRSRPCVEHLVYPGAGEIERSARRAQNMVGIFGKFVRLAIDEVEPLLEEVRLCFDALDVEAFASQGFELLIQREDANRSTGDS